MLHLFLVYLLSHLLADLTFQTDEMAKDKGEKIDFKVFKNNKKKFKALLTHISIHIIMIPILFMTIKQLDAEYIKEPMVNIIIISIIILIGHFLVDCFKYILKLKDLYLFLFDQLIHVIIIYLAIISILNKNIFSFININLYNKFNMTFTDRIILVGIIFLIGTYFGAYFIKLYLKPNLPPKIISESQIVMKKNFLLTCEHHKGVIIDSFNGEIKTNIQKRDNSSFSFGIKIGLVERTLIIILTSTNNYATIAVIIALKTLTRFKMIEQSKDFGEYYLMGNLLSLIFSISSGMLIKFIL